MSGRSAGGERERGRVGDWSRGGEHDRERECDGDGSGLLSRRRPKRREGEAGGDGERCRLRPRCSGLVGELGGAGMWPMGQYVVWAARFGDGGVSVMNEDAADGDKGTSGEGGVLGRSAGAERREEEKVRARESSHERECMAKVLGLLCEEEIVILWKSAKVKSSRVLKSEFLA